MKEHYPIYKYTEADPQNRLARLVGLDTPHSYAFDHFHAHEYYEILVFITGGGNHNINFNNHKIEDNSIHMLAARDLHWIERSMSSTGFAILYKEQFLQQLQMINPGLDFHSTFNNSRIWNLGHEKAGEFRFVFREMYDCRHQPAYILQVIGAFITKIASLKQEYLPLNKTYDPVVPELLKLVEGNFKTRMPVSGYARALNLSPRTLQNRFKKASSITINDLLQQRILKEAKKLLCTAIHMSVGCIASELGFKEPAHFSNWFKKNAGCLPLDYRCGNEH